MSIQYSRCEVIRRLGAFVVFISFCRSSVSRFHLLRLKALFKHAPSAGIFSNKWKLKFWADNNWNEAWYSTLSSYICLTNENVRKLIRPRLYTSKCTHWLQPDNKIHFTLPTEEYMTGAFPALFSTGWGEFLAPRRRPVAIRNYFSRLKYPPNLNI